MQTQVAQNICSDCIPFVTRRQKMAVFKSDVRSPRKKLYVYVVFVVVVVQEYLNVPSR
jgi:hypothetical protein